MALEMVRYSSCGKLWIGIFGARTFSFELSKVNNFCLRRSVSWIDCSLFVLLFILSSMAFIDFNSYVRQDHLPVL